MNIGSVQKRDNRMTIDSPARSTGRLLLVLVLLLTGGALRAWGQADTGRISGVVKDPSGAVVPGATVTATQVETGTTTTAKTDGVGGYTFASLLPGTYNVSVTIKGFATSTNQGYVLTDGAAITASFELKAASNTEEITVVTSSVDQVNTQTGEVSHVIDGDTVRDLALNGRNYLDLLGTLPGSVQAGLGDAISETTSGTTTNINLNGARATANGLYIDGFLNKDIGSNASQFNNVGIDFIDHVRVQTSAFSAQYGQSAGPTINVVTRAGSNKIHGTLFEFIRNSKVDATNYFSRNAITYAPIRAHLRYNDFGGALGGPIVIPHLFDGHDKFFFFIGTEWRLIAQQAQPAGQTLPLGLNLAGIFGVPGNCGIKTTGVYNPVTQQTVQSIQTAHGYVPFDTTKTCNISPYISPFGQAFVNEENYVISQATSYLGVACTSTGCSNNGNTIYELSQPYRSHQYTARVDWTISRRQSMYARWFADTHTTTNPIGDGQTPVTPYHDEAPANNVLISHSLVVSPSAVNEISFGALFSSINYQPYGTSWLRSSYGYSYQPFYVNNYKLGIPSITLYGYSSLLSDNYLRHYHPSYFQLQDIYTLVKARQTFKFGALIGRNRADTNGAANFTGGAGFTPTLSANTTGLSIADAELGNFASYTEAPTDTFGQFRLTSYAAFVDDIWRAASKLSINVGVRFEHLTPWTAVQDNLSDFYPNLYDASKAVYVDVNGVTQVGTGDVNNGLRRAGSGVPKPQQFRVPTAILPNTLAVPTSGDRGFYKSQYVVMPRFGFAYDLNGNGQTSFRGGVGLYYDTPQANANFSTLILPPYSPTINIENGNMDNVASYAGKVYPFAAMYTLDPNFQRTYVYQYNFGIQQQFPKNFFFQMNYVGAEGRHLLRHPDINGVDPSVEDCVVHAFQTAGAVVPVLDYMRQYNSSTLPTTAIGYTATGTPVNVAVKGSAACNELPPANSNGYGGYAGYDAIYQWRSDVDYNYNALQVNLNRRVGKGRLTLTYTFAKTLSTGSADGDVDHIELYSKRYNYGPTSFDRRNVVTSTYIVQAGPLQGHNLVMREALASWMLTGTARYQSGPLGTVSGTDELGVASRANYCGYPVVYAHTQPNWFYTTTPLSAGTSGAGLQNFTAPTVYAPTDPNSAWKGIAANAPCQGNYTPGVGDAPVGNIIGPRLVNMDVSARKTFELSRRYRLTVNIDSYNIFNHPNFGVPYLNVNSTNTPNGSANAPTTGAWEGLGSVGRPRQISGGARLYF
jgi:hypothetical protein